MTLRERIGRGKGRQKDADGATEQENKILYFFWFPLFFVCHMFYTAAFVGLRTEHWFFFFLVLFLCYWAPRTRLFLKTAFPLWIFGACYDSLRLIPQHWKPDIHVADLYHVEKALFGFFLDGKEQILPEYFTTHNVAVLDFACGLLYLTYFLVLVLFLLYLFFKDVEKSQSLAWTFLIVNLLGVITFQLFPAAPPWYVTYFGFGPADWNTPAHPAGTLRFDALIGYPICESIYRKSPDVFGALPSLHIANPVLIYLFARHLSPRWRWGSLAYVLGVSFSAVYLNHHYVLDLVFAVVYALVGYVLWEKWSAGLVGLQKALAAPV